MKTVYFISGMGADKRAFGELDLSFCNPVFLDWLDPLPGEDVVAYAGRMSGLIREPDPIIVGLSFGGMIAVEIAKQMRVGKLILVSSAKTAREIPPYYRLLRYLPLHRILSNRILTTGNKILYKLMGVAQRKDKKVFTKMLEVTDARLLTWSIDQLLRWRNTSYPEHTIHIHGTADRMLPYRWINADITVQGGEHLMLISKSGELTRLLKKLIISSPEEDNGV